MKLLHTADWHIGRTLNGYSLLEEQEYAFQQILKIAKEEDVDGIVIAGDLYDRGVPPVAAVESLDKMIDQLVNHLKIPVYAITGNHDGAKRMNFGSQLFKQSHFHLTTQLKDSLLPIETEEVQIYLLPYFEPVDAYLLFKDEEKEEETIRQIGQAIQRVVEEMKKTFDSSKKQVLVTHFAVTKRGDTDDEKLREQMFSETSSTVGGLKSVTTDLFKDFDAVLLGHIHTRFASPSETVFYSGSPVVFNTKEAKMKQDKGVYILEIEGDLVKKDFKPLEVRTPIIVLEENYETLISPEFYEKQARKKAWFAFRVVDFDSKVMEGINVRAQLQEIYGDKIIEIQFDFLHQAKTDALNRQHSVNESSPEEIIAEFYETVSGESLSENQTKLVEEILLEIRKEK